MPSATRDRIQLGGTTVRFEPDETIFAQGDRCLTVMYIESGRVRLSVASPNGAVAVMTTLDAGTFFGEGALAGQRRRKSTAAAAVTARVTLVKTAALRRRLRDDAPFSDWFRAHMLRRNVQIERDLAGRMLNGAEQRLARTLLLLTNFDEQQASRYELPRISRALLAEVTGTTRWTLDLLMASFKRRGFIDHGPRGSGTLHIHQSLVTVLLEDRRR